MNIVGVRVKVPATIANIGSGFDVLGMAITWHNTIEVERLSSPLDLVIEINGEWEGELPRDKSNICYKAFAAACHILGEDIPHIAMRLHNSISIARGLGSSAAARIGRVLAAATLLGIELSPSDALSLAAGFEGHTDNVSAALLGGVVISRWHSDGSIFAMRLPLANVPSLIVLIPNQMISTKLARSVLLETAPLKDAIFNLSRACLLVGTLMCGNFEHLREGVMDKLHQPYRQKPMP